MSSEDSADQFSRFGELMQQIATRDISRSDLDKIANVAQAVQLLETELRARYLHTVDPTKEQKSPEPGAAFVQDVLQSAHEVITEMGLKEHNANTLILLALIEARLQAPEKYIDPQEIARRIDRSIATVLTCKGTARNYCKSPYYIDSKRKGGWRLGKRETA